jgi:hypothetical protein
LEEIRVNQAYAEQLLENGSVYKYDKWLENYLIDTGDLLDEVQRLKYHDEEALIKAESEYRADEIMRVNGQETK